MITYGVMNYVFGAPGTGKTTLLAYLSRYFLSHGFRVYANFDLKDTIRIEDTDLGSFSFNDSILLLDELGISMSNRDFKSGLMTDKKRLRYMKKIRHYLQKSKNGACFVASQGWDDIDKKVRDLCTNYFLLKRWFGLTIIKPLYKDCDVDSLQHVPVDFFEFAPIWDWKFIMRRRYYKYFDSYDCEPLPEFPEPKDWVWAFEKESKKRDSKKIKSKLTDSVAEVAQDSPADTDADFSLKTTSEGDTEVTYLPPYCL